MPAPQVLAGDILPGFTLKSRTVAGAAAGNLTVTGIKVGDKILCVQPVSVASAELTGEFTVTAADTINNTGGTSSATQTVLVMWLTRSLKLGF